MPDQCAKINCKALGLVHVQLHSPMGWMDWYACFDHAHAFVEYCKRTDRPREVDEREFEVFIEEIP